MYLDDIIIYGKTLEEHNQRLDNVLERLARHNLKVKLSKCQFLKKKISFLGHTVTSNGVLPGVEKIEAVLNFAPPKNVKNVQSFLGLANYYRKFIPNFAEKAEPIINLTRKETQFQWSNKCEREFKILKKALTSAPVLIFPDYADEFLLTTYASGIAIGAVLSKGKIGADSCIL